MLDTLLHLISWLPDNLWQRVQRKGRGCRRLTWGCLGLLLLLLVLGCGLIFWTVQSVAAAPQPPDSLSIFLLIDNSNSMFEKDGLGSDPELLRIDAARLFISYLGVDNAQATHACGVIFFGSEAEVVVPLTRLGDDRRRGELLQLIQDPPRMGWTDQAAALSLALSHAGPPANGRQAVILLTDGKPEWSYQSTPAERDAYQERLRQLGDELAAREVPLFIILLASPATDVDPEIEQVWVPIWQEMVAATAPGRFYWVRQAEDLTGIYHDIVVALTGNQTAGAVLQSQVGAAGLREVIAVEPNLERLTLVISKSRPELNVTILQPDGEPLMDEAPRVRRAGQPGITREEVWVIEGPAAGGWTVLVDGEGRVTVWKDYRSAPATPTPRATQTPLATATIAPTATQPPVASATPSPTAVQVAGPAPTSLPAPTLAPTRDVSPGRRYGYWLAGLFLVAGAVAYGAYRRWQQRQPVVMGTLKVLNGPGFGLDQLEVELDGLRRQAVRIGAGPADVTLPGSDQMVTIRVGGRLGDTHQMLVSGPAAVLLNGRPLHGEQALRDADVITVGDTRLRYENLRLRRTRKIEAFSW